MEPVRRTKETMPSVDAYYADILNIPAHRDAQEGYFTTTRQQILRVQDPVQGLVEDPNVYMDPFFNNSPYLRTYDSSGVQRRSPDGTLSTRHTYNGLPLVTDSSGPEGRARRAGEMRAVAGMRASGQNLRSGLVARDGGGVAARRGIAADAFEAGADPGGRGFC
jgi:hypothetical protein